MRFASVLIVSREDPCRLGLPTPLCLETQCHACSQPATLVYSPHARVMRPAAWSCRCRTVNRIEIPGELIEVRTVLGPSRGRRPGNRSGNLPSGFTIATSCPQCEEEIEIAFECELAFDRLRPVRIGCPHCGKGLRFDSGRRVMWVAPRFSAEDTRHRH